MASINVKITGLDNAIRSLQRLSMDMGRTAIKPPAIVGGGRTVNELEDIAEEYKKLDSHLAILISNTIGFLQNVKNSYSTADSQAAKGISTGSTRSF